jgi:hypothetical protein
MSITLNETGCMVMRFWSATITQYGGPQCPTPTHLQTLQPPPLQLNAYLIVIKVRSLVTDLLLLPTYYLCIMSRGLSVTRTRPGHNASMISTFFLVRLALRTQSVIGK